MLSCFCQSRSPSNWKLICQLNPLENEQNWTVAKLLFNKHYNTKTVFQIQECQYKWISKAGLILVVCLCGLPPQRNEEKLELVFEKSPFSLFLGARHCTAILCHTSVMLSKEVSKELFWVWHSLKRVPAMMILSQRDLVSEIPCLHRIPAIVCTVEKNVLVLPVWKVLAEILRSLLLY